MESIKQETINVSTLPMGQRLLRAGYKSVTEDEMDELLDIKGLNAAYEAEQVDAVSRRYGQQARIIEYSTEWVSKRYVGVKWGWLTGTRGVRLDSVISEEERYFRYSRDIIPDAVLNEAQRTKQMGVTDDMLYVVYPVKQKDSKACKDPLLVVKLEEEDEADIYFLISRWA